MATSSELDSSERLISMKVIKRAARILMETHSAACTKFSHLFDALPNSSSASRLRRESMIDSNFGAIVRWLAGWPCARGANFFPSSFRQLCLRIPPQDLGHLQSDWPAGRPADEKANYHWTASAATAQICLGRVFCLLLLVVVFFRNKKEEYFFPSLSLSLSRSMGKYGSEKTKEQAGEKKLDTKKRRKRKLCHVHGALLSPVAQRGNLLSFPHKLKSIPIVFSNRKQRPSNQTVRKCFSKLRCNKLNNCSVTVSEELFGDPCEGTAKVSLFHFLSSPFKQVVAAREKSLL